MREMEAVHAALSKMGAAVGELVTLRIQAEQASETGALNRYFTDHGFVPDDAKWRSRMVRHSVHEITKKLNDLAQVLNEETEQIYAQWSQAEEQKRYVARTGG